jgi:hypothetical protein
MMASDCTSSHNENYCDLLSIYSCDNLTENVLLVSHSLPIDHGDSLVLNMQYHSQTVVVMNQS